MNSLKILILEDNSTDADIIKRLLQKAGYGGEYKVVMAAAEYNAALKNFKPDVILSDNTLPQFSAIEALQILQESDLNIPFILVTGTVSEEFAAGIIKKGADDYLIKDRLTRLPAAIEVALKQKENEKIKLEALQKLEQNEKRFRALVENNEGIISLIDENLFTTFRSSSAAKITGWSNSEFDITDTKEYTHPDDIPHIEKVMKEALANPGKAIEISIRVKHKEGHYIWLEGVINNMLHDPNVKGVITNMRDVTQRKKAEEAIKISEEKRTLIMNAALDAIICIDTKGNITFWNPQAEVIFGWPEKEVMGRLLSEIIIPETYRKMHEKGMENYLKTGKGPALNVLLELKAINRKNEEFPIELTVLPIKQGGEEFFCAFVRDITERKKVAEIIIANEKRFRKLVENGNDAFVILNTEGKPVYASSSVERVIGYTEEEVCKMDMFSLVHPDHIQEVQDTLAKVIANPGVPITGHISRLRHKDGTWHWYEDTITNLIDDPDIRGIVDNFTDITDKVNNEIALKASEEKYRTLVEEASEAIFISGPEGRFLTVNASACKISQYSEEELLKMSIFDFFIEEDVQKNPIQFEALQQGKTIISERIMNRKDGDVNHLELTVKMLTDGRLLSLVRDIAERKKAQEALMASEEKYRNLNKNLEIQAKELADSNAELEQFAYVASHDLQEPLRMVTSFLILLEKKYKSIIDDKGKQYINFAVDGAKRMRQIILDLLELSKVGRKDGTMELLDLNKVMEELQLTFQKEIEEENIVIKACKLPVIYAYKSTLQLVFQNLVGNSIKYKRKNVPAEINISVTELEEHWQFSIADNGIGINEAYFEKIFVVFQRLHNKNEFSGTGIGLAITRKIVESHGGKIWLESEIGKGSTFHFIIKKIKQLTPFY